MHLPLFLKLCWKEIRNRPGLSLLLMFSLSLGLCGLLVLNSFQRSIQEYLDAQVRDIMGGDLVITSNFPYQPEQVAEINNLMANRTWSVDQVLLANMIQSQGGGKAAKLVQVVAVGTDFPLLDYQHKLLHPKESTQPLMGEQLNRENVVWMSEDLEKSLGVELGQSLKIGDGEFRFTHTVEESLASRLSFLAFLPKVYIGLKNLPNTGLVGKLSRIQYQKIFLFKDSSVVNSASRAIDQSLRTKFTGSSRLNVRSLHQTSANLDRVNSDLSAYLSFLSIVSLSLAALGTLFIYQSYLAGKKKDMAVLLSLGATKRTTALVFFGQLWLIGLGALFIALLLSSGIFVVLQLNLPDFLAKSLHLKIYPTSIALATLLAVIGLPIFCFPPLFSLRKLSPNQLFQHNIEVKDFTDKPWGHFLQYVEKAMGVLPIVLFFTILTFTIAPWLLALAFLAIFLGVILVYYGLSLLLFQALLQKIPSKPFWLRHSWLYSLRNKTMSISILLVITLSISILNLILQFSYSLNKEFEAPPSNDSNQYILFDIQPEQKEPLKKFAEAHKINVNNFSPMLRAELIEWNSKPWLGGFENTGKVGNKAGSSNLDKVENGLARKPSPQKDTEDDNSEERPEERRPTFNLSYRDAYRPTETVVAGQDAVEAFSGKGLIPISLEEGFASRMGFKLHDKLSFELLGLRLDTEVMSLRKVLWTSFEPNFFILFPPNVLEDAPQTYIANISRVSPGKLSEVSSAVTKAFSNISMLDIRQTVGLILGYVSKILLLITVIAALVTLTGIVALLSILQTDALKTNQDNNLLKTLGLPPAQLYMLVSARFTLVAAIAGVFSAITAKIVLQTLSELLFHVSWYVHWPIFIILWGLLWLVGLFFVMYEIFKLVRHSSRSLLGEL